MVLDICYSLSLFRHVFDSSFGTAYFWIYIQSSFVLVLVPSSRVSTIKVFVW